MKLLKLIIPVLLFFGVALKAQSQTKPIRLDSQNSHYFSYKGRPAVLITSGEHYGAVINTDFNYRTYLRILQKEGLNLTRTMTGVYFEPAGAFKIAKNTLAPDPVKFICPWARSSEQGTTGYGSKFDLNQWNPSYFKRLKDFLSEAQKHEVIVELTLFCPFYEDSQWNLSPFNSRNNINNLGKINRTDVYTVDKNKGLLTVQEKLVRKFAEELKYFPNLIYEICNEPYFGGVTPEWQNYIAQVISDAEKSFPHKHLISQNIANGSKNITSPDPLVSVFNFHYAAPPVTVELNYHLNKVIGDNETGFNGQKDSTYRKEAWEFILAGGGLFNNLDYSFTSEHENGTFNYPSDQPGGGSPTLRKQLGYLEKFMNTFDFVAMKPDSTVYVGGASGEKKVYVLAETGKQYALYLMGGQQVNLQVLLPAGTYQLKWINPLNGKTEKKGALEHPGGKAMLKSPVFKEDIAVQLISR